MRDKNLCRSLNVDPLHVKVTGARQPTESLRYEGAATFSSGGETIDYSFQLSVILQEICSVR